MDRDELQRVLGLKSLAGEPVLCFVDGSYAYFTTQKLSKQWGDGWSKVPYEHNAWSPYDPCWHNEPKHVAKCGGKLCTDDCCKDDWNDDGSPKWKIIRVVREGPFNTPADAMDLQNSPYSVEEINEGDIPWLETPKDYSGKRIRFMAGTTLSQFIRVVESVGGGKVKIEEN